MNMKCRAALSVAVALGSLIAAINGEKRSFHSIPEYDEKRITQQQQEGEEVVDRERLLVAPPPPPHQPIANLTIGEMKKAAKEKVEQFQKDFEGLMMDYLDDRNRLIEEHQMDVFGAIDDRDEDLKKLGESSKCTPHAGKYSAEKCEEKRQEILVEHEEDLAKLVFELDAKATFASKTYLEDLAKLQVEALLLKDLLNEYHFFFRRIQVKTDEQLAKKTQGKMFISSKLETLAEINADIKLEEQRTTQILFKDMCFDFIGAQGEFMPDELDEVSMKLRLALELSFAEEKIDIQVLNIGIVSQAYYDDGYYIHRQRRLRREGHHQGRQLGRSSLKMQTTNALQCRCTTDSLKSDVYGRQRELFGYSSDDMNGNGSVLDRAFRQAMASFAINVRELIGGVFAHVDEVKTFRCNNGSTASTVPIMIDKSKYFTLNETTSSSSAVQHHHPAPPVEEDELLLLSYDEKKSFTNHEPNNNNVDNNNFPDEADEAWENFLKFNADLGGEHHDPTPPTTIEEEEPSYSSRIFSLDARTSSILDSSSEEGSSSSSDSSEEGSSSSSDSSEGGWFSSSSDSSEEEPSSSSSDSSE